MNLENIKGLNWPRPEELKKLAISKDLDSNELLALKSRSFYLPTWMLELTRGNDEFNKRPIITDLYNVLRQQDTIEDANPKKIKASKKIKAIDNFTYIIDQICRRSPIDTIEDLIKTELTDLTNLLKEGVMDEDEKIFVEHFGKGGVLQNIRSNAIGPIKEAIFKCSASMAIGMKHFLTNQEIESMSELDEYCGYVAGDVGVALNRIVESLDGVRLEDNSAKMFGRALQKTNVIKNIYEDWTKRGVAYIPKELLPKNLTYEELFDLNNKKGEIPRKKILETLVSDTLDELRGSSDYILSIPEGLTGYIGFTMIPYFSAIETLNSINYGGAEAVFGGKEECTKINSEVFNNISKFTYTLMSLKNIKKVRESITLFQKTQNGNMQNDYSFEKNKFEKWSKELVNP